MVHVTGFSSYTITTDTLPEYQTMLARVTAKVAAPDPGWSFTLAKASPAKLEIVVTAQLRSDSEL